MFIRSLLPLSMSDIHQLIYVACVADIHQLTDSELENGRTSISTIRNTMVHHTITLYTSTYKYHASVHVHIVQRVEGV